MGVSPKQKSKSTNRQQTNRTTTLLDWVLAGIWIVIVYATGSLALDSGSWWHYGATFIALGFLIRALRTAIMKSYANR